MMRIVLILWVRGFSVPAGFCKSFSVSFNESHRNSSTYTVKVKSLLSFSLHKISESPTTNDLMRFFTYHINTS